ncbi:hypothetical protein Pmani_020928 [Petrolisthes manimaculis]|uniref:Homeobox domain-containing protein n=1 Tax=Petrolisthes manimaculis TaxID=1843537 RepID=A0AAE1PHE9_9EUCA|nr:hypothetical protein Pmani_020928 [Petrolisthes manimaculis]
MVTRYTIDQILSHGRTSPRHSHHPIPPISPPMTTHTNFLDTHLATTQHHTALDHTKIHNHRSTSLELHPKGRETYTERSEGQEDEKIPQEKISSPTSDPEAGFPTLARPVAVRPPVTNTQVQEASPSITGASGDVSAGLLHWRLGYGMQDGGVYGAMVRQYLDSYYRGIPSPRPFLHLPYFGLDHGLVLNMTGRSRRRGGQVRFTNEQTRQLEAWFTRHKYITPPQRKTISRELSLQERQVKTWFQNRRAKWRKMQTQGEVSRESAPSPSTSHDGLSEEDPIEEKVHVDETTNWGRGKHH